MQLLTANEEKMTLAEYNEFRDKAWAVTGYKKSEHAGMVVYERKWESPKIDQDYQADTDQTFEAMKDNHRTINQAIAYLKNWRWHALKVQTLPYPEKIPLGLYIHGTHDASKTHLMHGFVNHIKGKRLLEGRRYRIYNWSSLIKDLKDFETEAFIPGEHGNTVTATLSKATEYRCKHEDLIIFDDIGSNAATKYELETITAIIEHRKDKKKDTFFTSNHSLNELKNALDKRIVQKILEMATSVNIESEKKNRHEIQNKFQAEYNQNSNA